VTSGEPPIRGAPLALSMRPRIELLLGRLAEGSGEQALADWSFSNLWLFRRAHDWRFVDGRWPLLEGRAYDGLRHVFPLFPLHEVPVSDWRALLGDCAAFYPLSASQAAQLPPQVGSREAVRDDADYLYEAGSFAEYRGAGLRRKRQLAARLEATELDKERLARLRRDVESLQKRLADQTAQLAKELADLAEERRVLAGMNSQSVDKVAQEQFVKALNVLSSLKPAAAKSLLSQMLSGQAPDPAATAAAPA